MVGFLLGVAVAIGVIVLIVVTFPIWWLLSGGDMDMHHWLIDGEGSIYHRWKHRRTNGVDPTRGY